jgi:hypothetical protein
MRVMSGLDDSGKLWSIQANGTKKQIATLRSEQADGAKRIHTLPDPWSHEWIAVVPEGLPRYWVARSELEPTGPLEPETATAYNIDNDETPVAFAWTIRGQTSSLALATSGSRWMVLDPVSETRKDVAASNTIGIVPGVNSNGDVVEWNALTETGNIRRITNLPTRASGSVSDQPLEDRLEKLTMIPEPSTWMFGRHGNDPVGFGLGKLPSGETGIFALDAQYHVLLAQHITVRPEQARVLSMARLDNGTLYLLASGPNRVLHLMTADMRTTDQASFEQRILGASLFAVGDDLKLVLATEDRVACWSIRVPKPPPAESVPAKSPS